jgi:hypothetical protein
MNNITFFSVYATDIFKTLHNAFPMAVSLSTQELVRPYLDVPEDRIKALRIKIDIGDILQAEEMLSKDDQQRMEGIRSELDEINRKVDSCRYSQIEYFEGTLAFLIEESLVREVKEMRYQLTAKGFSALNREFIDGEFKEQRVSIITAIKSHFANPSSFAGAVSSGALVSIIEKIIC